MILIIIIISTGIYSLVILVFQAIWLVHYLGVIEHYSLPKGCIMRDPNQKKMADVNSHFATISEAEILKIQEDAVPENTKKATKFVVEITEWVYTY